MKCGLPLAVGLLLSGAVIHGHLGQALTQTDADAMALKVSGIYERGLLPPLPDREPPPPVRTTFTDVEANAYFKFYGSEFLPEGVVNPTVRIGSGNRVTARAIVSLDEVRTSRERGWLDPLAYVSGLLEVEAIATLHAANGVGVVQLESARVGGVAVSKALLQELISYYTATPEDPDGYQLGEPGPLPSAIVAVELSPGSATVVQ